MKGWLPKSIVSESGSSRSAQSAEATAQPERKPGAAWDLEIEDTTTARSASSDRSNGEAKETPSKTSSS